MKKSAILHGGVFLVCIAGWIAELTQSSSILCLPLGILGAVYCLFYLIGFICFPIRRDWSLIKGHFLLKVVNFVLLVPFVLTVAFSLGQPDNQNVAQEGSEMCSDEESEATLEAQEKSMFWIVYSHYIDSGDQLDSSNDERSKIALVAILGYILLNGVLISTLVSWFDRRRDQWIRGEINYSQFGRQWCRRKHYVIIGGSDVVVGIVSQLFNTHNGYTPYILVQTSSDIDALRRQLSSTLTESQQKHLVLYYGSCTSQEDLSRLGLNNAEEVYIIGEDSSPGDGDSSHDTLNMECLELLQEIYKQTPNGKKIVERMEAVEQLAQEMANAKGVDIIATNDKNKELEEWWRNRQRLNCRVMFEYQTTFSVFQYYDTNRRVSALINFKPFNYYEMWAQNVLINREVEPRLLEHNFNNLGFLPLEGSVGIKSTDSDYVHLVVVGMSRMGVAMAIEAAHLAHYPNYTERNKIRTKITFIDINADVEKDFFMGRFKELFRLSNWRYGVVEDGRLSWQKIHKPEGCDHLGGDFLDIEWEFIHSGIELEAAQDYILESANSGGRVSIAICLTESNRAHAAALYLDKRLFASNGVVQVLVYNRSGNAIINALSQNNNLYPYCGKLRSFGCTSECLVGSHLSTSEFVGRQIDLAYNNGVEGYSIEKYKPYEGKSMEAMRWSSIYSGNSIWTKLRSVAFNPQEPVISEADVQILSDTEHNRWNMEELLLNFRPLTKEEQDRELASGNANRSALKSQMAHTDICSNQRLLEVDKGARAYDEMLVAKYPSIYKALKKIEITE